MASMNGRSLRQASWPRYAPGVLVVVAQAAMGGCQPVQYVPNKAPVTAHILVWETCQPDVRFLLWEDDGALLCGPVLVGTHETEVLWRRPNALTEVICDLRRELSDRPSVECPSGDGSFVSTIWFQCVEPSGVSVYGLSICLSPTRPATATPGCERTKSLLEAVCKHRNKLLQFSGVGSASGSAGFRREDVPFDK